MLFLCSIIFILFLYFLLEAPKSRSNLPPSPPRLPIIGNLHQIGNSVHRSLCSLSEKYGPLMLLHFGSVPTIIVSSKEMAYEVMKAHDLTFASRPSMTMAKMLIYNGVDVTFSPYGDYWRQIRKICVVHLLSGKMVQSFSSVREEEISLMVDNICASNQQNLVNLTQMIVTLISDMICRIALGKKYYKLEGGENKARKILVEFADLLGSFPIGDCLPWLGWVDWLSGLKSRARKNAKELDDFLELVLKEHVQAKSNANKDCNRGSDFVDVLLSLAENDEAASISLKWENMKALILDVFAAGIDTTSSTLEWAMSELIKNPKAMERAQTEVRGVVGCKQNVKEEDINRMDYMKAIIKETLRLHPPLPLCIPHEAMKDVKLEGYDIPIGTRVLVNAWAIGRDQSSWEKPEEFWPERFINSNLDFKGQDFQFIPFGAGRRMCPGINFAMSTIELILANLLHQFDWVLPKGIEEETLDMSESYGMSVHKKSNLVLIAKPWVT